MRIKANITRVSSWDLIIGLVIGWEDCARVSEFTRSELRNGSSVRVRRDACYLDEAAVGEKTW